MNITWLGHATVLIETAAGARLLTDPVLRPRIMHLRRHAAPPADPSPVDAVLVSHLHRDHFDKPSLRLVASEHASAVIPHGAWKLLTGMPYGEVHEVAPGDELEVAGARLRVVPAWHDGRRRPGPGALDLDTLGYLVDGVWFAGDTDLNEEMEALRGHVDCALLPIWGWGPSLGPGHMDPQQAARAVALVQPRLVIPIHWGTFLPIGVRIRDLLTRPPMEFARYVSEFAPSTRVERLEPGGSLSL